MQTQRWYYMSLSPKRHIQSYKLDDLECKLMEIFLKSFTFVVSSFKEVEDNTGGPRSVKI
jgi:hypothetical protein